MKVKIEEIKLTQIDSMWLRDLLNKEYGSVDENITALKILSKLGVEIKDQLGQLKYKEYRLKIKRTLKELHLSGYLDIKKGKHDTLGIKEDAYRIVNK